MATLGHGAAGWPSTIRAQHNLPAGVREVAEPSRARCRRTRTLLGLFLLAVVVRIASVRVARVRRRVGRDISSEPSFPFTTARRRYGAPPHHRQKG